MSENPINSAPTDTAGSKSSANGDSKASANGDRIRTVNSSENFASQVSNEADTRRIDTASSDLGLNNTTSISKPLPTGDISLQGDSSKFMTGELLTLGHDLVPVGEQSAPELAPIPFATDISQGEPWYQKKWIWLLAALSLLAVPAAPYVVSQVSESTKPKPPVVVAPPPKITSVTAIGRLEPSGEVTKLTASSSQNALVREVLVREGEKVVPNQVVAVLDTVSMKQAQLAKAKEDIRFAQTSLDKVKAGAKGGEIAAQRSEVLRIQQELRGEIATSKTILDRLKQQLVLDGSTQADRVGELQKQLAGEVATSESEVRRLTLVAENAETELQRYQKLFNAGGTTAILLDSKRLARDTARQEIAKERSKRSQIIEVLRKQISGNVATKKRIDSTLIQQIKEAEATYNKNVATLNEQINQAKANVDRIVEIRPVDLRSAESEIAKAQAAARQAQADLELAYVRSPIAGEVFKIQTKPGEAPSSQGILEIAQNDQMMAVAEVYESDISKVKVGQIAEINSESGSFVGKIQGKVVQVGLQVAKKDVLKTDPAADVDSRVVEVKIAIDPAQSNLIRGLTYSKVEVKILTE
jgi:HlyD family secretion protein